MNDKDLEQRLRRAFPVPVNLRGSVHDRLMEQSSSRWRSFGPIAVAAATALALTAVLGLAINLRPHGPAPTNPAGVVASASSSSSTTSLASPSPTVAPTATPTPTRVPTPTPRPSLVPSPNPSPTQRPTCTASEVKVTAASDAQTYVAGQTVHITTSITNTSNHVCEAGGMSASLSVVNSAGQEVFRAAIGSGLAPYGGYAWTPGQTFSQSFSWNQNVYASDGTNRGRAATGTYTGSVRWDQYTAPSFTFTLK